MKNLFWPIMIVGWVLMLSVQHQSTVGVVHEYTNTSPVSFFAPCPTNGEICLDFSKSTFLVNRNRQTVVRLRVERWAVLDRTHSHWVEQENRTFTTFRRCHIISFHTWSCPNGGFGTGIAMWNGTALPDSGINMPPDPSSIGLLHYMALRVGLWIMTT